MQGKSEVSDSPISSVWWSDCDVEVLSVVMSEELGCWVSLEHFFRCWPAYAGNTHCVDEEVLYSYVVNVDLENALLGNGLIDYHHVKR